MVNKRVISVFLLVFLSGCFSKVPLMQPSQQKLVAEQVSKIQSDILNTELPVQNVKALYLTQTEDGDTRERMRHAIVFDRPDKLRIEFLPVNGAYSLALLINNENVAQFMDIQRQEMREADSLAELIQEVLSFPALNASDLISVILGFVPKSVLGSDSSHAPEVYFQNETEYLLISADKMIYALVDKTTNRLKKLQFLNSPKGRVDFEINYDGLKSDSGVNFSAVTEMLIVRYDIKIKMQLNSIKINTTLKENIFDPYEVAN